MEKRKTKKTPTNRKTRFGQKASFYGYFYLTAISYGLCLHYVPLCHQFVFAVFQVSVQSLTYRSFKTVAS